MTDFKISLRVDRAWADNYRKQLDCSSCQISKTSSDQNLQNESFDQIFVWIKEWTLVIFAAVPRALSSWNWGYLPADKALWVILLCLKLSRVWRSQLLQLLSSWLCKERFLQEKDHYERNSWILQKLLVHFKWSTGSLRKGSMYHGMCQIDVLLFSP